MTSELKIDATHLALREIGPWLRENLDDADTVGAIELAVHELAMNSVDHANSVDGAMLLRATPMDDRLQVELIDRGTEIDRAELKGADPDVPQVRGYGLMILEQVAEDVQYRRDGDQNVWTVQFSV